MKIINENKAEFQVVCGKGTYIRSLVRDLAEQLNTMGHVVELRRNTLGFFDEKDAATCQDHLVALVRFEGESIRPFRVLNI